MTPNLRSLRWLTAVLPLLLLAACGGNKTDTPSNQAIAPENFSNEFALALCQRQQQCGLLAPYQVDMCKAEAATRIGPTDVKKAVDAGRLVYDADLARQCVNGIAQSPCLQGDLSDDVQATCNAALKGTVQKGAACSFYFECAAGTCGGTDSNTCPSTCPTDVLSEGAECSLIRGPQCDTRAGLRCSGSVCVKPAGQGAACVDNLGCASGFICVDSKCAPLAKEGGGCSEDASCAVGLFCQDNHCAVRKAEGQRCSVGPDEVDPALRGAQCQDGLLCKGGGLDSQGNPIPGTCSKPSAEGGACVTIADASDYLTGCLSGLNCVNGACVLPAVSGPCASFSDCRPGVAYCADDGTCQPLRDNGAACDIPPQCKSRNCADGVCAPSENFCHE